MDGERQEGEERGKENCSWDLKIIIIAIINKKHFKRRYRCLSAWEAEAKGFLHVFGQPELHCESNVG